MKIVIIGLGSMGTRHLKILRQLIPNAEIKVLRNINIKEVPHFSNGNLYSLDEVLKFAPEIAVVATPSTFHIESAQILAEAGINLFIEKPLSNSVAGIVQLIETCEKNKNVLMVGYNLRFSPSLQQFRNYLNDNIVGEIYSVNCESGQYLPDWRPEKDYRSGVSAKEELGGGVLLELSHEIDYLKWIFGDIEWTMATLSKQSNLEIDVEDTAHLIFGFNPKHNGRKIIGVLNLDFIRQHQARNCEVIGETGSLRWDGIEGTVESFTRSSGVWRRLFSHKPKIDETYVAEWENFLDCITNKKNPIVSGLDGLRVVEIVEAARKSSEFGIKTLVSKLPMENRPS